MKLPRFQFSLRALLIVVTMLAAACGYFGRQIEIVRERKTFCADPHFLVMIAPRTTRVSWTRRLLGDFDCLYVIADDKVSDSDLERCHVAFPEGDVRRDKDMPDDGFHFRNGVVIPINPPQLQAAGGH